jgi:hypothetical protein
VAHYNKTTLQNHSYFSPPRKIFAFFSPGHVSHYNKTTLKNIHIFHLDGSLMTIWPFQTLWILLIGRSPTTTIPLQKVFHKDHLFSLQTLSLFLLSAFFSTHLLDNVFFSLIYFPYKCVFEPSLQTLSEGLIISCSGESIISHYFFFFTRLIF